MKIPFNKPYMTGRELWLISQAHAAGHLSGDGRFTRQCHEWLQASTGCRKALLTHSCTAALEMCALLLDLQPGDEVIMPSFTFVSTANAFVLRGAVPVFVDIRRDTLNIDEALVEAAITPRTKAICVVHYAGVSCEMDVIMAIAQRHGLAVVEDAAQGIFSTYRGKPLGTFGGLGTLSFHETKNVISGEGGALLVNDEALVERAEIIREKGTNRSQFFRGRSTSTHGWTSARRTCRAKSSLPSSRRSSRRPTTSCVGAWRCGTDTTPGPRTGSQGSLRRPVVPPHCTHNAHMYYLLLPSLEARTHFIDSLKQQDIGAVFHYVPLHSSPAGQRYARVAGSMDVTDDITDRLVRLPLWVGLDDRLTRVLEAATNALGPPPR
jgi:dTDP-4-amino-4,6-dideoxygalactose transaminase